MRHAEALVGWAPTRRSPLAGRWLAAAALGHVARAGNRHVRLAEEIQTIQKHTGHTGHREPWPPRLHSGSRSRRQRQRQRFSSAAREQHPRRKTSLGSSPDLRRVQWCGGGDLDTGRSILHGTACPVASSRRFPSDAGGRPAHNAQCSVFNVHSCCPLRRIARATG